MLGIDELINESHWRNVQDPVRQAFMMVDKILKEQDHMIRALSQKCNEFVTVDQANLMIRNQADHLYSKSEASHLIYQLDNKVSQQQYCQVERKLDEVIRSKETLQLQVASQEKTITELTAQLAQCNADLHQLNAPNYGNVFGYVDHHLDKLSRDIDNKLLVKADKREMETAFPQRLEDLYRDLYGKIQDLKLEMAQTASKTDLIQMDNNKADVAVVKDLKVAILERINKQDMHQGLVSHMQPIADTIAALEKQLLSIEMSYKRSADELSDRLHVMQAVHEEITNSNLLTVIRKHPSGDFMNSLSSDHISTVVQTLLQERHLWDITPTSLQTMIAAQMETVFKQVSILCESLRLEMTSSFREEIQLGRANIEAKADEAVAASRHAMEKLSHTRKALKELAQNAAKELSKKVDSKDAQPLFKLLQSSATAPSYQKAAEVARSPSPEKKADEFDLLMSDLRRSNGQFGGSNSRGRSDRRHRGATGRGGGGDVKYDSWDEERKTSGSSRTRSSSPSPPRQKNKEGDSSELSRGVEALQKEMAVVQRKIDDIYLKATKGVLENMNIGEQRILDKEMEKIDWRLALGEVSMNLRREMADKISREEVLTALQSEYAALEKRMQMSEKAIEGSAKQQEVTKVENDLISLKQRISGELIGARFLWTSGHLVTDYTVGGPVGLSFQNDPGRVGGLIPWDVQVINSAINNYIWKKGTNQIVVRVPGLYRLSIFIFTTERPTIQLYLNDEPLITCTPCPPSSSPSSTPLTPSSQPFISSGPMIIQKLAHSIGEATSVGLEEYISLPPDARIKVFFGSRTPAQGFMGLLKL